MIDQAVAVASSIKGSGSGIKMHVFGVMCVHI